MIALTVALLIHGPYQDAGSTEATLSWAAAVNRHAGDYTDQLRAGLTGAQVEACVQMLDRMGHWERQSVEVSDRQASLASARPVLRLPVQNAEAEEWRGAAERLVDATEEILTHEMRDGDRASYAMMSAYLTFCHGS